MRVKAQRAARYRLIPAGALLVWTLLPALCAMLCVFKSCCVPLPETKQLTIKKCPRCAPTGDQKGSLGRHASQDCCQWIAERTEPPTTVTAFNWNPVVAVLPPVAPFEVNQLSMFEGDPPEYSGLAPPDPSKLLPFGRAPPVG